jgi:hypothetical protein
MVLIDMLITIGLRLLKDVVVEIGGQQIDKHYSDWMYIWNELSLPMGKKQGYENMVGADGDDLSVASDKLCYTSLLNSGSVAMLVLLFLLLLFNTMKLNSKYYSKTKANCIHYSSAATSIPNCKFRCSTMG